MDSRRKGRPIVTALVLCVSLLLQAAAPALAAEKPSIQLVPEFTERMPYDGKLDRFHFAFSQAGNWVYSLYALRNTAVEDLLRTRQALKALLQNDVPDSEFAVPSVVTQLYQGTQEFDARIRWLNSVRPEVDPALRLNLTKGLVHVTALLARYDHLIRFLKEDYWNHPVIRVQFYNQFVDWKVRYSTYGTVSPDVEGITAITRRDWMRDHGMDEALAVLMGHREFLFDRYHLLGLELPDPRRPGKERRLHHLIYEALERHQFIGEDYRGRPTQLALPTGKSPIPLPEKFTRSIELALARLAEPDKAKEWQTIHQRINPLITEALKKSLDANTRRLQELCSEIEYNGKKDSALLTLAQYPDLWAQTKARYGYLNPWLFFDSSEKHLNAYFDRVEAHRQRVRYAAYTAGIGLAVIGTVASFLTGTGAILGLGGRVWLIGSGIMFSVQSTFDYLESKEAARVAQELFLSSAQFGSAREVEQARLMEKSDFQMLIGSLVMLGFELPLLNIAARGREVVIAGGKAFVRLHESELATLRAGLARISARASELAPMGRALLRMAEELLGVVLGERALLPLERAIESAAKSLKMAPEAIRARVEANRTIYWLNLHFKNRVLASPHFIETLMREELTNLVLSYTAEKQTRGEHFNEEIGEVALNIASSSLRTAAMVWITSPTLSSQIQASLTGVHRPTSLFERGLTPLQRFETFYERGKISLLVGAGSTATVGTILQAIDANKHPDADTSLGDRAYHVASNAALSGILMMTSSNSRYQLLGYVRQNIHKTLDSDSKIKVALSTLTIANNYFGAWSNVKIAKWTGVQKQSGALEPVDDANLEFDREPPSDIQGLQIEELGSGYLRFVPSSDDASSYLFDFLR